MSPFHCFKTVTILLFCALQDMLNLTYNAVIHGNTWKGKAIIPWDYFPLGITRFNAYAIHGSATWKTYEALYPVPKEKFSSPDLCVYLHLQYISLIIKQDEYH